MRCLNKKGHIALGTAVASIIIHTPVVPPISILAASAFIGTAALGSLMPDLDHKTSTVSNVVQLSVAKRQLFRSLALICLLIGLTLLGLSWGRLVSEQLLQSTPLWFGTSLLLFLLSRLRTIVFIGAGSLLLMAYWLYEWHWIAAFVGIAMLVMPLVKHRGIIHSPEFAVALSIGLLSFAQLQAELLQSALFGLVIGWWAHLLGDMFGSDGIRSLLLPKIQVAMRWFANGGKAERWIARFCWILSVFCWMVVLLNKSDLILS